MKRLYTLVLLVLFSCAEDEPSGRTAATCRLVQIEQPREFEVSLRDEISYSDGKLNQALYYTRQVGKEWDYVERREYTYTEDGMDIQIIRPDFTINGSFVLDSYGNLLEYSDDFFVKAYRYAYEGNVLRSDADIRYIVQNANIVERIDVQTGQTIDRFTYDKNPNPLQGLFYEPIGNDLMGYFRFYNANNVLTQTIIAQGNAVRRYSYEYGPGGLPVKQTWIGTNKVTEYSYNCE